MKDMLTEKEKIMYSIMNALSKLPIVFKGSMVTSIILNKNGFDSFRRETIDIDANWMGTAENMDKLSKHLNTALSNIGISAEPYRDYGPGRSAGFNFYQNGELVTKMDMDIGRKIAERQSFSIFEYSFFGVTPDQIITDKLCAISTDKVFRRMKDVVDLYALSSCCRVKINDIYKIKDQTEKKMEDFSAFLSREKDLEHAYEKMGRMNIKPPFEDVYGMVRELVIPIKANKHDLVWEKTGWHDLAISYNFKQLPLKKQISKVHGKIEDNLEEEPDKEKKGKTKSETLHTDD